MIGFNNWLAKFLNNEQLALMVWSTLAPGHHCRKHFFQLPLCLTGQDNNTWPPWAIREVRKAENYLSVSDGLCPGKRGLGRTVGPADPLMG